MTPRIALAHLISIIGHPLLLIPATVAFSALRQGGSTTLAGTAIGAALAVTSCVFFYTLAKVRAARWVDTDASNKHERIELNLFLTALLAGACLWAWMAGQPAKLVAGLGFAGAIIVCALLLRAFVKLSLHVAFAVYGAFLLWPSIYGAALVAVLACAVAWSRLALKRHQPADIIAGAGAGVLAGLGFVLAG